MDGGQRHLNAEVGMRNAECGRWRTEAFECGRRNAEGGGQRHLNAEVGMRNAEGGKLR